MLIVLNAHHEIVGFILPETAGGRRWTLMFDTNVRNEPKEDDFAIGHCDNTAGRSRLLFALQADQ